MLASTEGIVSMRGWSRERLESYGNRLYKTLVYRHHAVDKNLIVFRALCTTTNPQAMLDIVAYLHKTLLAAEEQRANHRPAGEIILSL